MFRPQTTCYTKNISCNRTDLDYTHVSRSCLRLTEGTTNRTLIRPHSLWNKVSYFVFLRVFISLKVCYCSHQIKVDVSSERARTHQESRTGRYFVFRKNGGRKEGRYPCLWEQRKTSRSIWRLSCIRNHSKLEWRVGGGVARWTIRPSFVVFISTPNPTGQAVYLQSVWYVYVAQTWDVEFVSCNSFVFVFAQTFTGQFWRLSFDTPEKKKVR